MNKSSPLGPRNGATPDPAEALTPGQARVLGVLKRSRSALTLAEVSARTDSHENTVRPQLDALIERGLATRTPAESGRRGRPAWLYADQPAAVAPTTELAELAAALAGAVTRHAPDPRAAAIEAGRAWGEQVAGESDAFAQLVRLGFAPVDTADGSIRLTRCPLLGAAQAEPEVICGVHEGLMQALVAAAGDDPDAVSLIPFAEPGACRLRMP